METSLKLRPRRTTIELWRVVVLVAAAFSFALFAIGRVPSSEPHEAILTALRAIDINHASLQRDVLQARAGLLTNYDPVVSSIINLHATVEELKRLFPESGVNTKIVLDAELSRLQNSIEADEALVEQFKTNNALLQNSLSIANQMLSDLHASPYLATFRAMRTSSDLGNLMMRFAITPDEHLEDLIRSQLNTLLKSDAGDTPDVQSYVVHARTILVTLPSVDRTLESIQASKTSREAQLLLKEYLDAYGLVSVRSAWSRILLGSISILLCAYIVVLVYRLRSQTQRLARQLEFENLAADVKARFNEDFDNVSAAITDSLVLVSKFFDAADYAFAIVDVDSREIEQTFGNVDYSTFRSLARKVASKWRTSGEPDQVLSDRFYYHNLLQRQVRALPEGSLSAGSVAATKITARTMGVIFLEHNEVRRKPDLDEIRMLGHAVVMITQCLKSHRDREEREALEVRLEHAQRLESVGTLAGGIAHEFNNALGAILGYGEMALQVGRDPARTRQYVQEIVSSGQRAKHIIDQILTFSRKGERVSRPFDLNEAVRDILPLIRISMSGAVEVTLASPEKLPAIFGNPIEIQQVLMNLCANAAQAIDEDGEVQLSIRALELNVQTVLSHGEVGPGSYVIVSVIDSGVGMAQAILPHIFEPFFTTKAKAGGTGLGLAAVHGHVVGMGGKIHVESRPKFGTRFDLYFPASRHTAIPLSQFFNERTVPLGRGQIVLIALQDSGLRLMYEEKIAALGYEPVGFGNLASLKRWVAANARAPDLILLDLDLWPNSPDLKKVTVQFEPTEIVFLADPQQEGIDLRSRADITILRKPVSSISLATAMFNKIKRRSAT